MGRITSTTPFELVFGAGCLVGVVLTVLGLYLFPSQGTSGQSLLPHSVGNTAGNSTATVFAPDPEYTLRLVQAIGILLPLFVGLLRLTTSDQSEIGADVNKYIILGISLLVGGGGTAVFGGTMANIAGVLKLALVFVLLAFVTIGILAGTLFINMPTGTDAPDESTPKGGDDEDQQIAETDDERGESSQKQPEGDEADSARTDASSDESGPTQPEDETDAPSDDGSEQL